VSEKKRDGDQGTWQEGAGGLLLVAAAQETGLLDQLEETVQELAQSVSADGPLPSDEPEQSQQEISLQQEKPRVSVLSGLGATRVSRRSRLLTLLLLGAYGLRRPRDLRSYSGDALGLLGLRKRAYGYWSLERFLTMLATGQGAERFTRTLGRWTQQLWQGSEQESEDWYVDGHHKPVFTKQLVPRGLIGRTGKILGCRGLMLLHDQHGHPRLVLTDRGDWHVMDGLQELVSCYEHISGHPLGRRIVVDREGMGAAFLKKLADQGQFVITLLRSNQYHGLSSFGDVGTFVPLSRDSHGIITREVAPARFVLALPEEAADTLVVQVALMRDLRPICLEGDANLEAHLTQTQSTQARLIPIITTDPGPLDAVALASTYIHRWAAQENVIKDYLLPLGLDTNHGFAKTPVVNSEVAKKREIFQKHLETFEKWMQSAQAKYHQAINSKVKLLERIERDEQYYLLLAIQQDALDRNSIDYAKRYGKLQKKKNTLLVQQEKRNMRLQKLSMQITEHSQKCLLSAQKQRDLGQSLQDLEHSERMMYELDNRKDQVMTVFKVALANLAMWTRDQYFPDTYATATWERLAPFFRLPGIIRSNQQTVEVELRPFNDRQYNRDLSLLCQRVNQKQPHLPDGRLLQFSVALRSRPILDLQQRHIA
jgi:hypothetical protein